MESRHPPGVPPLGLDWASAVPRLLRFFAAAVAASPRPPRQAAAPPSLYDHLQDIARQVCPGAGWRAPADSAAVSVRRVRRWTLRRLQHGPASFHNLLTVFLDHLGQAGRSRVPSAGIGDVLERALELLISEGRIECHDDLLHLRQLKAAQRLYI